MMNSEKKIQAWQRSLTFPLLIFISLVLGAEKYPVYLESNNNTPSVTDTIPTRGYQEVIDTVITLDPNTLEETVEIVKYQVPTTGIDTVIVFDPKDFSEVMYIIDNATGKIDTIR